MCYFCLGEIHGKAERHHITPKRYIRKGRNDPENIAPAHSECHKLAHQRFDNPRWRLKEFRRFMEPIDYAKGIFAE